MATRSILAGGAAGVPAGVLTRRRSRRTRREPSSSTCSIPRAKSSSGADRELPGSRMTSRSTSRSSGRRSRQPWTSSRRCGRALEQGTREAGSKSMPSRLGSLIWLIGIAANMGSSKEAATDYVSPMEAVPRGRAPRMQVQLLSQRAGRKEYAVIFGQGDEAFSGLLDFAEKYHVTSAHFTAIGALNGATLGWFDPPRKMYKKIPIEGQVEVIGMSGDIALYKGKPVVHTHMMVGTSDGATRGGHVLEAYVSPTLEVMVTVDAITMQKRFDPETDLTLIDPTLK